MPNNRPSVTDMLKSHLDPLSERKKRARKTEELEPPLVAEVDKVIGKLNSLNRQERVSPETFKSTNNLLSQIKGIFAALADVESAGSVIEKHTTQEDFIELKKLLDYTIMELRNLVMQKVSGVGEKSNLESILNEIDSEIDKISESAKLHEGIAMAATLALNVALVVLTCVVMVLVVACRGYDPELQNNISKKYLDYLSQGLDTKASGDNNESVKKIKELNNDVNTLHKDLLENTQKIMLERDKKPVDTSPTGLISCLLGFVPDILLAINSVYNAPTSPQNKQ